MRTSLKLVNILLVSSAAAYGILVGCAGPESSSRGQNKQQSEDDLNKEFSDGKISDLPKKDDSKGNDANATKNDFAKPDDVSKIELAALSTALKNKSETQIVKAASEILGRNPNHLETLNALAVFYYQQQKYGLAKILIKRALKDHPQEAALHNNLGIIYLSEGDMRSALESFRKSLDAKPDYRYGSTNLSSIYLENADYKRSLSPLEDSYKALRADLRRGEVYAIEVANNYGVALMGIGENAKAEEVFKEIMDLNQRNPVPLLNYSILLVEVLKKKKDAVRVISKLKFMTEDRDIERRVSELEHELE